MLWFESLLFYGCEEQEQEKDDADISLLPTIVERVVLPKLTGIILKKKKNKGGGEGSWCFFTPVDFTAL